jgi:hypothetical protein
MYPAKKACASPYYLPAYASSIPRSGGTTMTTSVNERLLQQAIDRLVREGKVERIVMENGEQGVRLLKEKASVPLLRH